MAIPVGSLPEGTPLYRRDLLVMAPVTSRCNLTLMPPGRKGQVRVLAADDTGCIVSFQMVKGVPDVSWRVSTPESTRVEALAIGDPDAKGKYTVWYATGAVVRVLDKVGKEVSHFNTNSTETTRFLSSGGGQVWTSGEYVVNLFDRSGKDLGVVMCPDKVLSMATGSFVREGMLDAVVGCADRTIRLVSGGKVMSEVGVEGPVTALTIQAAPPGRPSGAGPRVWYGTSNGAVGIVLYVAGHLRPVWSFVGAPTAAAAIPVLRMATGVTIVGDGAGLGGDGMGNGGGSTAGVTSVVVGDVITPGNLAMLAGPGVGSSGMATAPNVCVARDDGSLEVYTLDLVTVNAAWGGGGAGGEAGSGHSASHRGGGVPSLPPVAGAVSAPPVTLASVPAWPRIAQTVRLEESVRAVAVGYLTTPRFNELVCQTFSGRVVCITPDSMADRDTADAYGRPRAVTLKEAHLQAIAKEMEDMRKRIAKEREKMGGKGGAITTHTAPVPASGMTALGVPPAPDGTLPISQYDVISHFVLDPSDASYVLSLEIPATIEAVVLQSSVPCDIVEGGDGDAMSTPAQSTTTAATATVVGATVGMAGAEGGSSGGGAMVAPLTFSTTSLSATLVASVASEFTIARTPLTGGMPLAAGADSGVSASVLLAASAKATAAIISRTPCDPRTGVAMLATFRCQESSTRVAIRMRTIEGQHGDLQVLVVNKHAPKAASLVRLAIKPLSLHHRLVEPVADITAELDRAWQGYVHTFKATAEEAMAAYPSEFPPTSITYPPAAFPFGTLVVTGGFSLTQMHEWVAGCLPDVPLRMTAEGGDEVSLAFCNVFLGTHLLATYRKGSARFSSDSPSALAIVKEVITSAATGLKVRLSTTVDLPRYALRHLMNLLGPKLAYQLTLQAKAELVEAVREMATTDAGEDKSFLHPDFADIMAHGDRYLKQQRLRQKMVDYTTGIATDAFVDVHKFAGHDVTANIPDLIRLLQQYHIAPAAVIDFMESGGTRLPVA